MLRARVVTMPTRSTRLPNDVAAASHGVLDLAELRRHGLSRHGVDHAVRSGDLLRLAPGIFAVAGSPDTVERRVTAGTRRLGGALAHESSLGWWDVPKFEVEPLHVMRLRRGSTSPPDLATLHRPTLLLPHHLTVWRGVLVTRPSRTLFDLAGTIDPLRVERAYDTMWSRGLITPALMERTLTELAQRGRRGITLMRSLIEARRHLEQPTGSRLEQRFEVLNERADIPMLRRQIDVGDDEWIGRMDFVGDERRLVVEIDSAIHHAALLDVQRDQSVTERLEAAGWTVLRIAEDDLWNDSTKVVRDLRAAWFAAPRARRRADG